MILYDGTVQNSSVAYRSQTYTCNKQVLESVHDGSKTIVVYVECGGSVSQAASFVIDGSLVDVEEVSTQRVFNITMDSRSNSEEDKAIKDGETSINVKGQTGAPMALSRIPLVLPPMERTTTRASCPYVLLRT